MHSDQGEGETLLELLMRRANCDYLSDLRFLDGERRGRLARYLADIPWQAGSLAEWNEALRYLLAEPPQETEESARNCLIAGLSH